MKFTVTVTDWTLSVCESCYLADNGVLGDDFVTVDGSVPLSMLPQDVVMIVHDHVEPYYSWHHCESCDSKLSGNRWDCHLVFREDV